MNERTAEAFVYAALTLAGDRYVFASAPGPDQAHPGAVDCSGLTRWAALRDGVTLPMGSWAQAAACRDAGTLLPIDTACRTLGALLFQGPDHGYRGFGVTGHVAISLGNGKTIEARGTAYGVGSWPTAGRPWSNAGLVPGMTYQHHASPAPVSPAGGDWAAVAAFVAAVKGSTLRRGDRGPFVSALQLELDRRAGLGIAVDGIFGPLTDQAVRAFQAAHRLRVDGIVGRATWSVLLPG